MHQTARSRSTGHKGWTLILASFGAFMTALDTLVVATALPELRTSLGATLSDLEWTVNAYNLAFACLLLTGAALGDRFGRKRMFILGLVAFTAASAMAALSTTVAVLVAARAAQGVAAAIIMPMTLTLISEAFPTEKRGTAIGIWGGVAGLAVAAGPLVGGGVIEGISWHWIFWINVPVGLILAPLGYRFLTESHGPRPQLDLPGLAMAIVGFFSITWGLVRATDAGWSSAEVISTMTVGSLIVLLFIGWQLRTRSPMISLDLFRNRGFASANGVSFFMYASLFGALFLMTQLLQFALGDSPFKAGLHILPWTAVPMLVSPIAGALADRFGNRPFLTLGMALQAVGLGWVALIAEPGMAYSELVPALVVAGVGIALVFPTVANTVVGSVSPSDMGIASGTNSSLREIGGVFGIAILATVFVQEGVYSSPAKFIDGFSDAMWISALFSVIGIFAALAAPSRSQEVPQPDSPVPAQAPAKA